MSRRTAKLECVSSAAWNAAAVQLQIHELFLQGKTCDSPELIPLCNKMDELRKKFERPEEHLGVVSIGGSLAMRRVLAGNEGMQSEQYAILVQQRGELHTAIRREQLDEDLVLGISEVALQGSLNRYVTQATPALAA